MNKAANRCGLGVGVPETTVSKPQTGMDSIHGSVIVTPAPRRNVRRDTSWEPKFVALDDDLLAVGRFAEFINVSFIFRNLSARSPLEESRRSLQPNAKRRTGYQYTPSTTDRNT